MSDNQDKNAVSDELTPLVSTNEQIQAIETVLNECMARISDVCVENLGGARPILLAVNLTGKPAENSQYSTATNCEQPSDLLILRDLMTIGQTREEKNNYSRIVLPDEKEILR